ncbi:MAG: hypothetical protein IMY72_05975 [Bacteroidetes bacterium]|nr:hypothetical protein [Bacteroidota bacterium]
MILYRLKNIQKWSFWRKKNKFVFCLASGLLYGTVMFLGAFVFRLILGDGIAQIIDKTLGVVIGSFIAGTFLSIALWYENERRYKKWLKEESK